MELIEQNKLMREALERIKKDCRTSAGANDDHGHILANNVLAAIGPAPIAAEVASILSPDFLNLTERLLAGEVQPARKELVDLATAHIRQAVAYALAGQEANYNVLHQRGQKWKAEAEKAEAERDVLRAEVKEWLCSACNTIYPGPPSSGFSCVICPKCAGFTGPRRTVELDLMKSALAQVAGGQVPVSWMRKWAADGEKPAKVKGKWPGKFKFKAVTETKIFPDDVPLYATPQPAPVAGPVDERAEFDKWLHNALFDNATVIKSDNWAAWQARAALDISTSKGTE